MKSKKNPIESLTPWMLIRSYKGKSVFFYYLRCIAIIILLIFVPYNISIFYYQQSVTKTEITRQSLSNIVSSANMLDLLLSDFDRYVIDTYANTSMMEFLALDAPAAAQSETMHNSIGRTLSLMRKSSPGVEQIFFLNLRGEYVISCDAAQPLASLERSDWWKAYQSTKKEFSIIPRRSASGELDSLYWLMQIKQGADTFGLLCVQIPYSNFEDMIARSFPNAPDQLYILSDIGLILYSTNQAETNSIATVNSDLNPLYQQALKSKTSAELVGDYVVASSYSEQSNLVIVSHTLRSRIVSNDISLDFFVITGSIVMLLLVLVLAVFVSYKMYRYIVDIVLTLNNPSYQGNSGNAFGELFYIRDDITSQNSGIAKELEKKVTALKQAQSAALQSQINPHFLFNTLQLINMSIMKDVGYDNDAIRIVTMFSDLMRTSYNTRDYLVSVEKELEIVGNYLSILEIRYKDRLQFSIHCDPTCQSLQTIKMILLPIVENSIMHGMEGAENGMHISIHCEQLKNDSICYRIRDDGAGMSSSVLSKIRQQIKKRISKEDQNIGLSNVNTRLNLVFGNSYTMEIDSRQGKGTCVTICHPPIDEHTRELFEEGPPSP